MTKSDIRSKGTKTDEELAREWMKYTKCVPDYRNLSTVFFIGGDNLEKTELIEKELGKERLEFLVHKLQTQDKMKEMEGKIEKINEKFREESLKEICRPFYDGTLSITTSIDKKKSFLSKCWGSVKSIDMEKLCFEICLPILLLSLCIFLSSLTFCIVLEILRSFF